MQRNRVQTKHIEPVRDEYEAIREEIDAVAREMEAAMFRRLEEAAVHDKRPYRRRKNLRVVRKQEEL